MVLKRATKIRSYRKLVLTFLIEAENRDFATDFFGFFYCIAALRKQKSEEIWRKKIILQPIEKSQDEFLGVMVYF